MTAFMLLFVAFLMVLFMMSFMHVEHGALGDFIILHVDVLITVGQVQATHIAAQCQINRLAVVDRLGLGTESAAETLKVRRGNTVIDHIHNAADRTVGVHQSRWTADNLDLLNVIEADVDGVIGAQS